MSAQPAGAEPERLLTVENVAAACQVSQRTVMRAIAAGELEAFQLASRGTWRISPAAVAAWLAARSSARRHGSRRPVPEAVSVQPPPGRPRGRRRAMDEQGRLQAPPKRDQEKQGE